MDSLERITLIKENLNDNETLNSAQNETFGDKNGLTETREELGSGNCGSGENNGDAVQDRLKTQKKTKRELKKLEFDNKKFVVNTAEAGFVCVQCGEMFLYESQLRSHGVFNHPDPRSSVKSEEESANAEESFVSYRCNMCSKLFLSAQAYLNHFDVKKCRDNKKHRLTAFDSCVCLLCGFATTRSQLTPHVRSRHSNAPILVPKNKDEPVFSCPMCALDGGGSVVVASGSDLMVHLSTWHPTAVVLENVSSQSINSRKNKKPSRTRKPAVATVKRLNGGKSPNSKPGQYFCRYCFRCLKMVTKDQFGQHFGACKGPANGKVKKGRLSREIAERKSSQPKPGQQSQPPGNDTDAKPADEPKLVTAGDQSSETTSASLEEPKRIEQPMEATSSSDANQSTLMVRSLFPSSSDTKPSTISERFLFPQAQPVACRKRSFVCSNCRKEFSEPLDYFTHHVNRFCHGNRGLLHSSFCPLCHEAIQSAPAMLEHVRRSHCGVSGLRVDKSLRIESSELASEIIGFINVCSTCGRGFYSKSRCNAYKPHLGTKVPLQEILRCSICNLKVKSKIQLALHLWAIHDFGLQQIAKTLDANEFSTAESIAGNFLSAVYDDARVIDDFTKQPPMLLKCSSCTTRFASMDTLEAHNMEFHQGARQDDADFHQAAKVFFYRQNQRTKTTFGLYSTTTLFDDLWSKSSSALDKTAIVASNDDSPVGNGTHDGSSLSLSDMSCFRVAPSPASPVLQDNRMMAAAARSKRLKTSNGSPLLSTSNPPPGLQYRLPLPPLVRMPNRTAAVSNQEIITLADDELGRHGGLIGVRATSGTIAETTSFVSSAGRVDVTTAMPTLRVRAPTKPVVLRAYSLRPSASTPRQQLVLTSSSSSYRTIAPNNAIAPPNVVIRNSMLLPSSAYRVIRTAPSATAHQSVSARPRFVIGPANPTAAVQNNYPKGPT